MSVTVTYHGPQTQYATTHPLSGPAARATRTRGRVARPVPLTGASLTVSIDGRAVEFRGYRWVSAFNQWQWYEDEHIRPGVMFFLASQGGVSQAFQIGDITPQTVAVRRVAFRNLGPRADSKQINVLWQRTDAHDWLGGEIYRNQLSGSLTMVANLAIVVAIGTGIAFGAGFGPCAAGMGLQGGLTGTANAVAGGLASALTQFIHGMHQAQVSAVNTPAGAQHFWRAESTNFTQIVTNSIISGTFAGATSYLPGPSSLSSPRDWGIHAVNRLGNHLADVIQTLVSNAAGGNPRNVTEQQVRQQLQQQTIMNVIVRMFG